MNNLIDNFLKEVSTEKIINISSNFEENLDKYMEIRYKTVGVQLYAEIFCILYNIQFIPDKIKKAISCVWTSSNDLYSFQREKVKNLLTPIYKNIDESIILEKLKQILLNNIKIVEKYSSDINLPELFIFCKGMVLAQKLSYRYCFGNNLIDI